MLWLTYNSLGELNHPEGIHAARKFMLVQYFTIFVAMHKDFTIADHSQKDKCLVEGRV